MQAVTMISPATRTVGAAFRRFSDTLFIKEALDKLAPVSGEPRKKHQPEITPLTPVFTGRGLVINLQA